MNPTRRQAIVAAIAISGGSRPPLASADEPALTLSTFATEITPTIGHPCMGSEIAPVKEVIDPLFAHGFPSLLPRSAWERDFGGSVACPTHHRGAVKPVLTAQSEGTNALATIRPYGPCCTCG